MSELEIMYYTAIHDLVYFREYLINNDTEKAPFYGDKPKLIADIKDIICKLHEIKINGLEINKSLNYYKIIFIIDFLDESLLPSHLDNFQSLSKFLTLKKMLLNKLNKVEESTYSQITLNSDIQKLF